jgi:glycerol-3-phosphate O-acyltransferase
MATSKKEFNLEKSNGELNLEKLTQKWLHELNPSIDMQYMNSKANMLDKLHSGVLVSGIERVKEISRKENTTLLYVCEHLSEQDFFELPKLFNRENMELPGIFAGKNLYVPILTKPTLLVPKPLVLNFDKAGTIVIDRDLFKGKGKINSAYKRLYLNLLDGSLDDITNSGTNHESLFTKPTLTFLDGRSYMGYAREFKIHNVISFHNHALKNPEVQHIINPVSITNERTIEDTSFSLQSFIKSQRPKFITSKVAALADIASFFWFYFRKQQRGEIYLDFSEPINVSEYSKRDRADLIKKVTESVNDNIRITPVSLVSTILKYYPKRNISKTELLEKIHTARGNIPENLPLSTYMMHEKTDEEVLARALLFLNKGRIPKTLPYRSKIFMHFYHYNEDRDVYRIHKKSTLIKYYSNRIAHHNISGNIVPIPKIHQ